MVAVPRCCYTSYVYMRKHLFITVLFVFIVIYIIAIIFPNLSYNKSSFSKEKEVVYNIRNSIEDYYKIHNKYPSTLAMKEIVGGTVYSKLYSDDKIETDKGNDLYSYQKSYNTNGDILNISFTFHRRIFNNNETVIFFTSEYKAVLTLLTNEYVSDVLQIYDIKDSDLFPRKNIYQPTPLKYYHYMPDMSSTGNAESLVPELLQKTDTRNEGEIDGENEMH